MLDDLPSGYRAVFNLAVVDGYTHEEVAETLGITVGTSKSNLSRARQYLRRLLRNELLEAARGTQRPAEKTRKRKHSGRGILWGHARPPVFLPGPLSRPKPPSMPQCVGSG